MGVLESIGGLIGGNASGADLHAEFDRTAREVPHSTLAESVAHAFNSDKTPPFQEMLSGLFGHSDPNQKAGVLNQLLAALGPGVAARVLGSAGVPAGVAGALQGGAVTPQQAQQVPPEAVEVLAKEAAKKDPSIVDQAAGFYAQHPTLVKAIGVGALAMIMSKISSSRA